MRGKCITICLVSVLILMLSLETGQRRLDISRYDCPVGGLPPAFEGFCIVQLSDLHGARFGKNNCRLIEKVRGEDPDMIVLTGDFIEKKEDLAVTGGLLPQLAEIAPCYFVSGNHEWACEGMAALNVQMEMAGIRCLDNAYVPITRGCESILLCGVVDPNSKTDLVTPVELVNEALMNFPGMPIILLGHRNYWAEKYPELPVELIFCGHAHGGIVRIPGLGGLLGTDRRFFPDHTEGMEVVGNYHMIVSRGLGRIYGIPRFFNSPEIVVGVLNTES